jgi:hypothetical protein
MFITTKPKRYAENNAWMREISTLWIGVMSPDETFGGLVPVFCGFSVYEDGLAADFFVLSNARAQWMMRLVGLLNRYPRLRRWLPDRIADPGIELGELFRRGVRVLVDKDGLAERLRAAVVAIPAKPILPPSRRAFQHAVDDFLVGPPRVAANLRRGRLMAAMKVLDLGKRDLLRWMEWHARAKNDWKNNQTEYRLKWIDRWADPRALETLPRIYSRYETDDMWRTLFKMMELFGWLVAETAELQGYDYSSAADAKITAWVKQCFAETADQD